MFALVVLVLTMSVLAISTTILPSNVEELNCLWEVSFHLGNDRFVSRRRFETFRIDERFEFGSGGFGDRGEAEIDNRLHCITRI